MGTNTKMWALLVHLGNWGGSGSEDMNYNELLFDDEVWDYIVEEAPKVGVNTIVLDICAGIDFASHPEITIKGAWTRNRLRKELARCKEKGIALIPKLNFATPHSLWLGEYRYMISSTKYYQVCNDLIKEAYELFEHPEYIHIGMDEEDAAHVKKLDYAIYRQGELYWHDLRYLIDCVKDTGAKPWMWSCPLFEKPEEYKKNIDAEEVILSPWYYNAFKKEHWTPVSSRQVYITYYNEDKYKDMNIEFVEQDPFLVRFREVALPLMKEGYKYIPCAATCNECEYNAEDLMDYFKENAPDKQILGYIIATWKPTIMKNKTDVTKALKYLKEAREKIYG